MILKEVYLGSSTQETPNLALLIIFPLISELKSCPVQCSCHFQHLLAAKSSYWVTETPDYRNNLPGSCFIY